MFKVLVNLARHHETLTVLKILSKLATIFFSIFSKYLFSRKLRLWRASCPAAEHQPNHMGGHGSGGIGFELLRNGTFDLPTPHADFCGPHTPASF